MSAKKNTVTTKKRAKEIKKRYLSTATGQLRFGPLFNTELSWDGLQYSDCSEGFTAADVEKLLGLACELELDKCLGFDGDLEYNYAPVHAMNALLLLVSSDHSIADIVARRIARRCAETNSPVESDFVIEVLGHNVVTLLCACGPTAIPHMITEMRRLILTPNLSDDSWIGASFIADAIRGIILECYKDIPLAISLTDQFCTPLLEYGKHPTAIRDPVNKTNAAEFLSKLVDIAILITDEKEVLELCRSGKCLGDGYDHCWIDVLRMFSLEPHPQDERIREDNAIHQPNRMDWVIQTWNQNHPDKQYPFPRGVVDGPFPGQAGYELPKRLFRHKYCAGTYNCGYATSCITNTTNTPSKLKVCERCEHTYYCCEACQRLDWYGSRGDGDRKKLETYPLKFRVYPLKRLTKYYGASPHRRQCLLIQAYKQWVKRQKQEEKRDGEHETNDEGNGKGKETGAAKEVEFSLQPQQTNFFSSFLRGNRLTKDEKKS